MDGKRKVERGCGGEKAVLSLHGEIRLGGLAQEDMREEVFSTKGCDFTENGTG